MVATASALRLRPRRKDCLGIRTNMTYPFRWTAQQGRTLPAFSSR